METRKPSYSPDFVTQLCTLSENEDQKSVEELVANHPNCLEVNENDSEAPVLKLAQQGKHSALEFLANHFKGNIKDIFYAYAIVGDEKKAEYYADKAQVDADEYIPIRDFAALYAYGGHHALAKKYISRGANVTDLAKYYKELGNIELFDEYLKYGADIFSKELSEDKNTEHHRIVEARSKNFNKAIYLKGFKHIHVKEFADEKKEAESKYKFHLNFDDLVYRVNNKEIINVIKDVILEYKDVVHYFKYCPYSSETIENSISKARVTFWQLKLNSLTEGSKELSSFAKSVKRTYKYDSDICNLMDYEYADMGHAEIESELAKARDAYEKYTARFIGSTQVTLYFHEKCNKENLASFASLLESRLNNAGYSPGIMPSSDLSISKFISMRQDKLDDSKEYVPGFADEEVLVKLKNQLRESEIYKAISKTKSPLKNEIIALDWDGTLVELGSDDFYKGVVEFLEFLRKNNYQVIIISGHANLDTIQKILKSHQLDDFIKSDDIYTKDHPDWKEKDYTKANVLDEHRKKTGLEKNSYLMIDDNQIYLDPIQKSGYPVLKVEHIKGKAIPVNGFFKRALAFINPLADLASEIQQQIDRYHSNGQSCFGIGNNKKAARIKQALARAKQNGKTYTSLDNFLDAKFNGLESLREALSYHRIGFFGRTRSQNIIETKITQHDNRVTFHK